MGKPRHCRGSVGGCSLDRNDVKKNRRDFALWKLTDDMTFDSPWGAGRPGWHIECSSMTHTLLGSSIDIHSGGIDLAFPHHCNEIAQCEAHNQTGEWVQAFVHILGTSM